MGEAGEGGREGGREGGSGEIRITGNQITNYICHSIFDMQNQSISYTAIIYAHTCIHVIQNPTFCYRDIQAITIKF